MIRGQMDSICTLLQSVQVMVVARAMPSWTGSGGEWSLAVPVPLSTWARPCSTRSCS